MVCSLSVSATGIIAIFMEFPVQVANTTSIVMGEVQGDLYGERFGADNQDLVMQHLFKSGSGEQQAEMNYFCRNVNFSSGSKQIEYVFKFILSEGAENGVLIKQTQSELTNNTAFTASYKVGYGKAEPKWETAEDLVFLKNYVVDGTNPYIWLRATLSVNEDAYLRISGEANWTFSFSFEGLQVEN